jgi:hypothetical protein
MIRIFVIFKCATVRKLAVERTVPDGLFINSGVVTDVR